MKLIKTQLEWQQWFQDEVGRFAAEPVEPPIHYPCFAYTTLESWGQETLKAVYLYRHDVEEMAFKLVETEARTL